MSHTRNQAHPARPGEAGIALIMALLALMVLTVMGLTLAATTSTEVQVASNYRWSQEALYNAEAGIEIAKHILRAVDWNDLPAPRPRGYTWDPTATVTAKPTAPAGLTGTRNNEMWGCDSRGQGMGYGYVFQGLEYQTAYSGQQLNGAFTLWSRWPINFSQAGAFATAEDRQVDYGALVIVSEGVAPREAVQAGGGVGAAVRPNRAVQIIEVTLYNDDIRKTCDVLSGQVGGGQAGANIDPCHPLTAGLAIPGI